MKWILPLSFLIVVILQIVEPINDYSSISLFVLTSILLFYNYKGYLKFNNIFSNKIIIVYCIFIFLFFISLLINRFEFNGLVVVAQLILYLILVLFLSDYIKQFGIKKILILLNFSSFCIATYYFVELFQFYNQNILSDFNFEFNKFSSFFRNKNLLASSLFMLSPFVIYKIKISNNFNRLFSILVLIQIIIIVTITLSRAVIFASLISIVTYIIISFNNDTKLGWKNSVIVLFSMIIIIASSIHLFRRSDFLNEQVYKTVELNSSGRGELNNSTLRLVKDNIFFGVGPSNWKIEIWNYDLYKKGVDKDSPYVNSSYFFASNPHNDYLWVASEIGVLGSFVYMLFLFLLLNELLKLFKRNEILYKLLFSTLIGFIFISYFSFPLIQTVQPYLIMVIVAIVISSNRIKVKSLNHNYINLFLVSVLIVFSLNLFSKYMYSRSIEFQNENNLDKMIANMDYALMINDVDISSTPLKWYTGISKYKQGKIKEALIDFLAAKEVNPFHVHNLNNIGTCYHNLGDIETSKRFYSLSLEYVNCFYESRKNLAVLYNNDGLYKEALEVLLLSKVDSSYEVRLECSPEYDYHLQKILFNFLDSHNPLFSNSNQCEIEKQKYLQSPGVYRNYLKVYMIEDNSLEEYVKKLSIE